MGTNNPTEGKRLPQLMGRDYQLHQEPYPEEMKGGYNHPPPLSMGIPNASQTQTSEIDQSRMPPVQAAQKAGMQVRPAQRRKAKGKVPL